LNAGAAAREWTRFRRVPEVSAEAMAAHFVAHFYHKHSHDTYSFGVTEAGAQAFRCRGADHVSTAGLVMAFNPDDPHDGHAGDPAGFTYRMVHVDPQVFGQAGLPRPLFREPVIDDPPLAARVRRAASTLLGDPDPLAAQEALDGLVLAAATRGSGRLPSLAPGPMEAVRELLHASYPDRFTADQLAEVTGGSRFQVYRLFRARYGLSPSDYLRQLRLRAARRALAAGEPVAAVAAATGFADQAHLTRWFRRAYGVTPAVYRRGAHQVR
jgi:AraC-like DNA-binding protein